MRWLLELALGVALAGPVGSVLPAAPTIAPGTIAPQRADPLALARARYLEGDDAGVVSVLTPWLEAKKGPSGRERTAATLLLGIAHMELGNDNLASASFTRVRTSGGPLASYGAWYEAVVDHRRGRHSSAAAICKDYRTQWPDGPEADNCLLLMANALAAAGNRGGAAVAFKEYQTKFPDSPYDEEIRLNLALSAAASNPAQGIPMLQELAISYTWRSTAIAAQQALDELGKKGHQVALPTDLTTRMRLCESARRSGRFEDAWAMFQEIAREAPNNPEVARWVEQNEDRIAWGTRNFDVVARGLEAEYEAKPNPELAWRIFTAWTREGEWQKATAWADRAKKEHANHYRWKRPTPEVAWARTLAGQYAEARADWEALAKAGGDAKFYAAFCAYRQGDLPAAETAFSPLVDRDGDWTVAATYWRSRVRAAANDATGAEADALTVRARDRYGWYRLLLDQTPPSGEGWVQHDGAWHGELTPQLPALTRAPARPLPSTGRFPSAQPLSTDLRAALDAPATNPGWSKVGWPLTVGDTAPGDAAQATIAVSTVRRDVPESYNACAIYDPVAAERSLYLFAEKYKALWPALPAVHDLAQAGVYVEASRQLSRIYQEWDDVRDGRITDAVRAAQIAAVTVRVEDWRQYVLYAHNGNLATRTCSGLDRGLPDEASRKLVRQLAWPIVHGAELWEHGRNYNVDPLLMLGLMRQESTYVPWARSPVNAIGLVQVMPSTGAKVAALMGETRYSPDDLEVPSVNLRYGTYYFSLLLKRFDGVFPLAVASYNGGPHNVSRWYKGWRDRIPLDVFVEQIQYPETRDYVKRVTGYYAEYVSLYGDPGAEVVLPAGPRGDDAAVVDF